MQRRFSLEQPVLILGGFLITDEAYEPLANWLRSQINQPVVVVHVSRLDWLLTSQSSGWIRLLDRVDAAVRTLHSDSSTGRVTLIGHSSGGVMLRPYLSHQAFGGRAYGGEEFCNHLITLGSPHQALRATSLRSLVSQTFPGCPELRTVEYVSIAGELNLQGPQSSSFSRLSATSSYRQICGDSSSVGDGLVPVCSALLEDSIPIVLPNTAHGGLFGKPWYGSPERIEEWWSAIAD
ncbi:esterase/lipase family protein [Synechococcus sp. MIT S1220]|uniref:esterase/lipase family protein n=1 Tax=Synechococcus sp. MIT S1220 TaxID=3082549 RepID=UPI0039AFBBC9